MVYFTAVIMKGNPMTVLEKLRFVSWCHLKPVTIQTGHVAIDPALFPAAGVAFAHHSALSDVSIFGGRYGLLDISGLNRAEVTERTASDEDIRHIEVSMVRFLQCLEWIHEGNYETKFPFNQIVAYLENGEVMVAKPTDDGFEAVPYPGDATPWTEGTLLLFLPNDL